MALEDGESEREAEVDVPVEAHTERVSEGVNRVSEPTLDGDPHRARLHLQGARKGWNYRPGYCNY